jgi:tetratricopeptide (TPR) repeat protein
MPLLAEGEFALVIQHLESALRTPHPDHGDHDLYAALADTAAQQRDREALLRYAPKAEGLAARYGHKQYQAIADRAWGVAHRLEGDYPRAEARLRHALESFTELGTRWQMARTLAELGELATAHGLLAEAADYYSRALDIFETMGARPDASRVRAMLSEFDQAGQSPNRTSHP